MKVQDVTTVCVSIASKPAVLDHCACQSLQLAGRHHCALVIYVFTSSTWLLCVNLFLQSAERDHCALVNHSEAGRTWSLCACQSHRENVSILRRYIEQTISLWRSYIAMLTELEPTRETLHCLMDHCSRGMNKTLRLKESTSTQNTIACRLASTMTLPLSVLNAPLC